jgi:hypothetical protein
VAAASDSGRHTRFGAGINAPFCRKPLELPAKAAALIDPWLERDDPYHSNRSRGTVRSARGEALSGGCGVAAHQVKLLGPNVHVSLQTLRRAA